MSCSIIFNQHVCHFLHTQLDKSLHSKGAAHAPARRLRSIMWPKSLWRCEQLQQVRPKWKPAGNIMRHVMASAASKSFDGKPISKQAWEIISVMYCKPIWTPLFLMILWLQVAIPKSTAPVVKLPFEEASGNRRHRHWNLRPQALKTAASSMCRNPWQTHLPELFVEYPSHVF